jgi:hypothetical protein
MAWQHQANNVSILRLGYNDHGPVHTRIVTLHPLKILGFLRDGGIQPSIVFEKAWEGAWSIRRFVAERRAPAR